MSGASPTRNPHFRRGYQQKKRPENPHTRKTTTPEKNAGRSMFPQVEEFYLTLERHETPFSSLFIRGID